MSISLAWSNTQQTALALTVTAPWTWDEYEQASADIEAAFSSVMHKVDLIIDLSHAGYIPKGTLYFLRDAYSDDAETRGEYIFVNAPDKFEALFRAVDRYYTVLGGHLDFRFIESPDLQLGH